MSHTTTTKYFQLDDISKLQIIYADQFFDEVLGMNVSASQLVRYLLDEFIGELDQWSETIKQSSDSAVYTGTEKLRRDVRDLRKTRALPKPLPKHFIEMTEDNPMSFREWLKSSTS